MKTSQGLYLLTFNFFREIEIQLVIIFFFFFRYNNHPMLNERYLLLMLLGKGGFSEVHKVS